MYYGDQLPSLPNYNTARNWYDTRKVYKKGRSKGLYPLGGNRRYDRSLISIGAEHGGVENGGREFVICSYYGKNVITFYSDNSIVINNGGYETIANEDFINSILRNRFAEGRVVYGDHEDGILAERKDGILAERKPKWSGIIRRKGKMYFSDGYGKDLRFERILKIAANNEVTGGVVEKRLELNQELMGKLRKHYAEFTEYLTYYVQMIGNRHAGGIASPVNKLSVHVSDLRWGLDKEGANRTMFFHRLHEAMKIGKDETADKDAKLNEFLSLAEEVVINASMKHYDYKMAQYFYWIDPQRARDHFYEVCRYYYAKFLFSYKEVEMGKVVLNENKKYMDYASHHATLALPF